MLNKEEWSKKEVKELKLMVTREDWLKQHNKSGTEDKKKFKVIRTDKWGEFTSNEFVSYY